MRGGAGFVIGLLALSSWLFALDAKAHDPQALDLSGVKKQIQGLLQASYAPYALKVQAIELKPLSGVPSPKNARVLGVKMPEERIKKKDFALSLELGIGDKRMLYAFLCEVEASLEVVQARRDIKAGEDLSLENTLSKRVAFDSLPALPALKSEVLASSSRSFIPKGSILTPSKLKARILVKRGDLIEVRYEEGQIWVVGRFEALQNASLDQVIKVKNLQSQKIIKARIISKGRGVLE